jgi:uncharacterized protein (TIGR00299 family) protein
MKLAYLDCFSGVSGDMFLGALLDAGLPFDELERALQSLSLEGYALEALRESKNHLFGTRFKVTIVEDKQGSRSFAEIRALIQASRLSEPVKAKSLEIFESLAVEEGKIHHCAPEDVHFHEVGATDSIIDIVGSVFGIAYLDVTTLYASSVPLGSGFAETRHGRIPIPAPATVALLKGIPVYDSGLKQELVTPTGAALLKGVVAAFGTMPPIVVETVGYGVGTRDLTDRPNLLRIMVGRDPSGTQTDTVIILEANLDDTNPEWFGFLMDRLFEAGALDVVFCPIQMKKNRPGLLVQVMGQPHQQDTLMEILFKESSTLGIRFRYSQRKILERAFLEMESPWGTIRAKKVFRPDGSFEIMPEYEACRKIAEEKGLPLKEIYRWVIRNSD